MSTFAPIKVASSPPDSASSHGVRLLRELLDVLEHVGLDANGSPQWVQVMDGATVAHVKSVRETKRIVDARKAGLLGMAQRGVELWAVLGPQHPMVAAAPAPPEPEPQGQYVPLEPDISSAPEGDPSVDGMVVLDDDVADFVDKWRSLPIRDVALRTRRVAGLMGLSYSAVIRLRRAAVSAGVLDMDADT